MCVAKCLTVPWSVVSLSVVSLSPSDIPLCCKLQDSMAGTQVIAIRAHPPDFFDGAVHYYRRHQTLHRQCVLSAVRSASKMPERAREVDGGCRCEGGLGKIKEQTNKSETEKEADRKKSIERKNTREVAVVVPKLLAKSHEEHRQCAQIAIVRVGCMF